MENCEKIFISRELRKFGNALNYRKVLIANSCEPVQNSSNVGRNRLKKSTEEEIHTMLETWEEFLAGPQKRMAADTIRVSMTRKGEIRLNAKALTALGEPEAVVLLYDRLNSRIGIRASSREVANAFPLHRSAHHRAGLQRSRSRSALIYASPFCKFYRIRNDRTLIFADPNPDNEGNLVLDLKQSYEAGKQTPEP